MGADQQADYGSTWYAGSTPLPPPRTALNYDLDVDVCIIGGGLAGLTVAREAARRGWSVAILDARRIAWNASGRNGGVVLPGFAAPVEKVVERIGVPATKALWELSLSGVQYIRCAVAEIGDTGIIEGNGWLGVTTWPDADRLLARVALLGEMGIEAEGWKAERVRDTLRSPHYFDAIYFADAFQINPLAYALGLASAALQSGVRIFENTRVTAVDLDGIRKRIETPRGRVRADHVVLAGNVHLGGTVRTLADTLIPVTAFTGVTRPLGKRLPLAVAFGGAVSHSRHAGHHYRIVGDDRLLWTGRTSGGARWARISLERAIRRIFPQLGPVQFEHFWPAETGFAVHGMPQIGEVQRGVWLASGFGTQGLNTSAAAGNLIARAIVERDDSWHHFLPFELVWAGGRAGRVAASTAAWWGRRRDGARELVARQREEFQRKRLEKKTASPGVTGGSRTSFPSSYNPMATFTAARRTLKSSLAPDDRPIDAPEAVPATGVDGDGSGTKDKPAAAP